MIVIRTPLRISFFGGGTDFPDYFRAEGGSVLSSAIDKYVYVIVKERFDDKLRVSYTRTEDVDHVDQVGHELIREALKKTGVSKGIEIVTMGDIPAGTGLGSSSAITVGALQALYAFQGITVPNERLAREACEIEIDRLKKPIGYQDQYIAALGGLRFFEFRKDGTVGSDCVELSQDILHQLSDRLLLFYTGTTRKAENILTEQKDKINNNLETLGKLKKMAEIARQALIQGEFQEFGSLLSESWLLKKSLASGISNNGLEDVYLSACKAGALGGKIAGAGGGGFLMLFCMPEKKQAVRAALAQLRELPFHLEPDGTKIIFKSS
jgi:D-glycero-alpha-D-manno-heptose-7-phosphate kinase